MTARENVSLSIIVISIHFYRMSFWAALGVCSRSNGLNACTSAVANGFALPEPATQNC